MCRQTEIIYLESDVADIYFTKIQPTNLYKVRSEYLPTYFVKNARKNRRTKNRSKIFSILAASDSVIFSSNILTG